MNKDQGIVEQAKKCDLEESNQVTTLKMKQKGKKTVIKMGSGLRISGTQDFE